MDPITLAVVSTITSSLLTETNIKNGYNALKNALKKKFGAESDLVNAVDKLEKKPDSEGRKAILQEEFEVAKVSNDPDFIRLAQDLLDKIKEQPVGQQTINQTQTNTVSGVNVGGNFDFRTVQKGGSK